MSYVLRETLAADIRQHKGRNPAISKDLSLTADV
jgi:hypothetical protein